MYFCTADESDLCKVDDSKLAIAHSQMKHPTLAKPSTQPRQSSSWLWLCWRWRAPTFLSNLVSPEENGIDLCEADGCYLATARSQNHTAHFQNASAFTKLYQGFPQSKDVLPCCIPGGGVKAQPFSGRQSLSVLHHSRVKGVVSLVTCEKVLKALFSNHVLYQLENQSAQLARSCPCWWKKHGTMTTRSQNLRNYRHIHTNRHIEYCYYYNKLIITFINIV